MSKVFCDAMVMEFQADPPECYRTATQRFFEDITGSKVLVREMIKHSSDLEELAGLATGGGFAF